MNGGVGRGCGVGRDVRGDADPAVGDVTGRADRDADEMASPIVISDEETCRMARDLARLTGETITEAITVALRERLARERRQRSVDERLQEMRAISKRCASQLRDGPPALEHGDLLYDEQGLPE